MNELFFFFKKIKRYEFWGKIRKIRKKKKKEEGGGPGGGGVWVSGKITKTKKIRRRMYYEWVSQQTPKTKNKNGTSRGGRE